MAGENVKKEIMDRKPRKLSSKMGKRNMEVRPVGAWVQPEPVSVHHYQDAVLSAQVEEERIRNIQHEKAVKLKQFQEGVKRRVQMLEKLKREQQLDRSYKAVEVERNILCQSSTAAENATARRNRCSVRNENNLAMRSAAIISTQGGIITDPGEDEDKRGAFEEHTHKIHKFSQQARRNLLSRRVVTDSYPQSDLPGGVWKTGPTLDHPASRDDRVADDADVCDSEGEMENLDYPESKSVHFDFESQKEDTRQERIARRSVPQVVGSDIERALPVPNIYPGVVNEEEKVRAVNQRAMYRRLFMDIEREQVKENARRKQHRKKIDQLKNQTEQERQRVERQAQQFVEPTDPMTGETAAESFQREQDEDKKMKQYLQEQQRRIQKIKDSERFLEALKRNLREKIEKKNLDLPALCCCGSSLWDTNPDTCANNCVFYKNPKAYAKALQSLLSSCDVL